MGSSVSHLISCVISQCQRPSCHNYRSKAHWPSVLNYLFIASDVPYRAKGKDPNCCQQRFEAFITPQHLKLHSKYMNYINRVVHHYTSTLTREQNSHSARIHTRLIGNRYKYFAQLLLFTQHYATKLDSVRQLVEKV